ncbi:MAG: NADH-quinone oxidoreductase subunit M [Gammaproteobacteria bacterium]|nr:MAG: NADH-quinone oxidoreductase subunit M [Gammaproteobacteria bacterium]TDJ41177.1 MAG: NADH-quinone oxidoreductase subunit M [Gammaproteobacteria bacterium]
MNLLALILLMLAGGGIAWVSERFNPKAPQWVALFVLLLAGFWVYGLWVSGDGPIYAETKFAWIPRFGISVYLSLDGLSLMLVALTLFLGVVAIASSWTEIRERTGFFQFNLIWTLAGLVGVFAALDLFLFFLFWEVMLIPMYFLIAIWGHENRGYAAMKFFLFTQASGLLMLLAIVALVYQNYATSGVLTFDYQALLGAEIDPDIAFWIMLGFFIAFVVKLPGVPFHTWLPDAHTQAPTAGSVILAGVMLKTGAYGLIRFVVPLFPEAALDFRWPAMVLGAVSVIYGGYMAFSQSDFKRLVAYSSVSHMGFVLLGVFAWNQLALQGSIVQMLAHGFSSAALFMLAGALQERLHTREMSDMGGLWVRAPRMGVITLFFVVASLGMPGLGTFVGEFLVLLGAFQVDVTVTVAAAIGIVFAAVYSLSLMQRSFQGPPNTNVETMADFGLREMSVMLVMALALVWLGIFPQAVLEMAAPSLASMGVGAP